MDAAAALSTEYEEGEGGGAGEVGGGGGEVGGGGGGEGGAGGAGLVNYLPRKASKDELSLSQHQNPLQRTTGTALGLWETMKD